MEKIKSRNRKKYLTVRGENPEIIESTCPVMISPSNGNSVSELPKRCDRFLEYYLVSSSDDDFSDVGGLGDERNYDDRKLLTSEGPLPEHNNNDIFNPSSIDRNQQVKRFQKNDDLGLLGCESIHLEIEPMVKCSHDEGLQSNAMQALSNIAGCPNTLSIPCSNGTALKPSCSDSYSSSHRQMDVGSNILTSCHPERSPPSVACQPVSKTHLGVSAKRSADYAQGVNSHEDSCDKNPELIDDKAISKFGNTARDQRTLLPKTETRNNNNCDVAGANKTFRVSRNNTGSEARSNITITPNTNNRDGTFLLPACSEICSVNASGAAQPSDGICKISIVNYFLKHRNNFPCGEPLLPPLVAGTLNSSYSDQKDYCATEVKRVWLNKLTMGDVHGSDKRMPNSNVITTVDGADIQMNGVKNGYKNSIKQNGKSIVPGSNKVGDDSFCDDEKDDGSGPCGWSKFKFACCQRFKDAKWFLVVLTMCGICQGMAVNGFVNTVISTVERRYEISSTESGLIASCYDIMFVVLVIPISYFGGHGHKPRYLGIGILVLGIGSFVFALPQLISERYIVENASETVCKLEPNTTSTCSSDQSTTSLSNYKYFFYAGQLLHGAGATPLYTLGVTFMDENVPQRSSSFFNGIFYTGAIVGPAIGYMVGAKFLDMYTEVGVDAKSLGLDPSNPKWVGAWWMGFLISGTFGILLSLPLLAFPSALPGSKRYALERGKETQASKSVDQTGQHHGFKDIFMSLKYLLTNIPFMFINLAAAADGILLAGFSTFMPKFIEYEFGLPAGTAALYVGFAVIPAGGGATFVGGYLVKLFNLKVRGILRLCTIASFALCVLTVVLLMECDTNPFAGVTLPYGHTDVGSATFLGKNLDSPCNSNCSCEEEDYFPVCGRDRVLYFSPCYAGCTDVISDGSVKKYSNCSCVNYNLTVSDYEHGNTHLAEFGKCEFSCKWLAPFMIIFAIMIVFVFITSMPSLTATLRCVPDHQRSFGLGIQWIVARCLGSIPGPILFGKMFDYACLVWQKRCHGDGSCFFYDTHKLSLHLLALAVAFAVAAAVSFLLALCFYKVKEVDDEIVLPVNIKSEFSRTSSSRDVLDLAQDTASHADTDFTGTKM